MHMGLWTFPNPMIAEGLQPVGLRKLSDRYYSVDKSQLE
jgi:hypothetical protein